VSAEEPQARSQLVWIVWRQDDNGNRFEVARLASRVEAESLAAQFEARGHRQAYWITTVDDPA